LQGVNAPPAAAVSFIVSPGTSVGVTSSTSAVAYYSAVNTVTGGKPHDVSPPRGSLYGDYADRLKDTEPI
jgi:hypothetical protein